MLLILVAAAAIAGAVTLFRSQAAGEGPGTPTPSPTLVPSATSTAAATALPTATPTPLPASLAAQAVQTYWNSIAGGKFADAYTQLTDKSQRQTTEETFAQQLQALISASHGITPEIGTPTVNGTRATVPVKLIRANSTTPLTVTQHLLWENQSWHIDTTPGT